MAGLPTCRHVDFFCHPAQSIGLFNRSCSRACPCFVILTFPQIQYIRLSRRNGCSIILLRTNLIYNIEKLEKVYFVVLKKVLSFLISSLNCVVRIVIRKTTVGIRFSHLCSPF